jgi:hypothetical protein
MGASPSLGSLRVKGGKAHNEHKPCATKIGRLGSPGTTMSIVAGGTSACDVLDESDVFGLFGKLKLAICARPKFRAGFFICIAIDRHRD